nr:hypothetical protein [uncultured Rhodopila sp.]
MKAWAEVVRDLLRPGGELYLFDFHPVKWLIEAGAPADIVIRGGYFAPAEGYREAGGITYADTSAPAAATPTVQWNHPLGEVVTALADAGFRITALRELDRDVIPQWTMMERTDDGMYRMPGDRPSLPLMYVLRACRESGP